MKKYIILALAAIFMLSTASDCNRIEEPALDTLIVGTWDLSGASFTKSATIGSETIDVTITFNADGTFAMSQVIGRGRAAEYDGNWTILEDILSGQYSDGTVWGSQYQVSIENTTMTMTSVTGGDIYTYTKK